MGYVSLLKVLIAEFILNPRVVFLKAIFFPDLIHKDWTLYQPWKIAWRDFNKTPFLKKLWADFAEILLEDAKLILNKVP